MINKVKTPIEIERIRISGKMLGAVLRHVGAAVTPGITTGELDDIGAREIKRLGGKATFYGFEGFPRTMCISVNEEIQHAIPGKRVLAEGDIVNLDGGVTYEGMITDAGITVGVGSISPAAQRLINATKDALARGIDQVKPGAKTGDISHAVETRLRRDSLGIVKELAGHGVGHELHEDPSIPNYGFPHRGTRLLEGMTIAIEPIATLGKGQMYVLDDDWTLVSRDNSWAAQFEHTVLVTDYGAEILTL
ncbi:type I methionyl aminopeptidase [Candidatus Saccharibacteria bacterium]|nr:type I methionyl aminopeptidase [Candidatus Saccharibacteria bacterium]